jgi:hypothetical protein
LITEKEVSSARRRESTRQEKEEQMENFLKVEKRKLKVDEANAWSREKKVEIKETKLSTMYLKCPRNSKSRKRE